MTAFGRMLSSGLVLLMCVAASAKAEEAPRPMLIGTKEAPPFAMKGPSGQWTGISIELWRDMAAKLKLSYEFRELDLDELLAKVANGSLDAGVAAITVTADRERVMDFTHPFYTTGLGIAISPTGGTPWLAVLRRVVSRQFLAVVGLLALLLIGVGTVVWLLERRRNSEHFGGRPIEGIGAGFWWSAVTMTTVGYGDKTPRTVWGRLVALLWMFASIIIISSFTAAITSALTVGQLGSPVRGPRDLPNVRVAAITNSTGAQILDARHVDHADYPDALGALQALAANRVDAVVYDAPILQYLAKEYFRGAVAVLPNTFVRQDYAIAVAQGSPLRESLNRQVESEINSARWRALIYRYLGTED
jgi:polar amino acid transport system substrate-binding protein